MTTTKIAKTANILAAAANGAAALELIAILAVIAISAWHVGNHMVKFDGAIMSTIMGAVLGLANALAAYRFVESDQNRTAAGAAVIFFAGTSIWLQISYYQDKGAGPDAYALGAWAPAAEILLGWLRATTINYARQQTAASPTATPATTQPPAQPPQPAGPARHPSASPTATLPAKVRQTIRLSQNGGFATDRQLAEMAGWSETTARRYRRQAEELQLIARNGDGHYHPTA